MTRRPARRSNPTIAAHPSDCGGEIAKAYVVLKLGAPADAESIPALCRSEIPA